MKMQAWPIGAGEMRTQGRPLWTMPKQVAQIAMDIAKNVAMGVPAIRAARLKRRRIAETPNADSLVRHVDMLVDAVSKECGGLEGKAVLEIGPGDNVVTGLAFLALGAKAYTVLDRFPGDYFNAEALSWYALLRERLGRNVPEPDDPRIHLIGRAVERAGKIGKFDVICSNAVGEHVSCVHAFARLSRIALAPGGTAVHIVDFSGHHWHRDDDPDLFRRFPDWLWHAMGSNRGLPNRVSYPEFLSAFDAAGLHVSGTCDKSVAVIVASHPPTAPDQVPTNLARRFRQRVLKPSRYPARLPASCR